jgi:hypothetical protein
MPKAIERGREELRKLVVIAAFFSAGFLLIMISERLFTRGSGVEIAGYARALIGGLIVAKVLLIVDLAPFVHAFPDKPLIQNIVWKSSLYVAASVIFLYLDPLVEHLFKGMSLSAAHHGAIQEVMRPRTLAILIWLAMLLAAFVTMQELSRVIGREQLKQIFFGSRNRPSVTRGSRRAA